MEETNGNKNNELLQYMGLATQWIIMLGVSLWLGMKLDLKISPNSKILTISFPLIALTFSLYQLIKKFTKPKK
jgi:hypothetical protein